MNKISTVVGRDLKWTQPRALKKEYELHAGDELVATLRFKNFSSHATAECADGSWTFQREGFVSRTVSIRTCETDTEIGVFKPQKFTSGGTLELGGRTYVASGSVWTCRYTFARSNEEPLLEFKNSGYLHHSAQVVLHPGAANTPELPLMMMLGWYLDVLMQNDAAAVAAA